MGRYHLLVVSLKCISESAMRELLSPSGLTVGLPPSRLLAVCKSGGGRPGPFYHVNDVLGRQGS